MAESSERLVFKHNVKPDGNLELKSKFGRQKSINMYRINNYYYVTIYDNRPHKNDKIVLGFDELDALHKMRCAMEDLKCTFDEHEDNMLINATVEPPFQSPKLTAVVPQMPPLTVTTTTTSPLPPYPNRLLQSKCGNVPESEPTTKKIKPTPAATGFENGEPQQVFDDLFYYPYAQQKYM